jgi:hypothetical protein
MNVMRRVRTIHMLRPIIRSEVAAIAVMLVALYFIGRKVWVARIFENMPKTSVVALFRFSEAAFLNTEFVVQILVVITVMAFGWALREMVRAIFLAIPRMA